jgi:hypothetical protein
MQPLNSVSVRHAKNGGDWLTVHVAAFLPVRRVRQVRLCTKTVLEVCAILRF